jgi:flagellar biosynthesis/type III secretory pathway protein FliH
LNPADMEAVQQWAAGLAAALDQRLHLKLVTDPAVDRGGCQLVGQHISVDATLATQLDRIAAALCAGAGEPDALPPSEPPA